MQPTTLLKELISTGCVRRRPDGDGRLQVLRRDYIPQSIDAHMVRLAGARLTDLATTHSHNLTRTDRVAARFERAAVNDRIPSSAAKEFRKILEQEGQAFLERMDAWLTAQQRLSPEGAEVQMIRLGVGVYHIQD